MIFQNDVAIEFETSILLEEPPAIQDDLDGLWACKDRKPANDGAGHEIGEFGFIDAVARAGHEDDPCAKQSFAEGVPKQEFGNEGKEGVPKQEFGNEGNEGKEGVPKQEFGNESQVS